MKIYISGQITGLTLQEAQSKFDIGAEQIKTMGHEPVNPMQEVPYNETWTWEDYMIADIRLIFGCDGIYMLDNWTESKGAKIEHDICLRLGKKIMFQEF